MRSPSSAFEIPVVSSRTSISASASSRWLRPRAKVTLEACQPTRRVASLRVQEQARVVGSACGKARKQRFESARRPRPRGRAWTRTSTAPCQSQTRLHVALGLTPVERQPAVGVLALERIQQRDLLGAVQPRLDVFCQAHGEQRVPTPNDRSLAAGLQTFAVQTRGPSRAWSTRRVPRRPRPCAAGSCSPATSRRQLLRCVARAARSKPSPGRARRRRTRPL